MTSTARKVASKRRPAAKRPKERIARVRALPNGAVAVLANDPAFRKHVADAIKDAPEMKRAAHETRRLLAQSERNVERVEEMLGAIRELHPAGEMTAEQRAAREELFAEMLEHGPAPTDEEMAQAARSWL